MASLALRAIEKSFGPVKVLHGIDLDVADGELVVFVGPSGCGKSTLLRIVAGLESASGGEVRIDGERVNDMPAADRRLAMVFQSYALYPHMTVYQNLSFGLENARMKRAEIDARVQRAARMLQIEGLLQRKPRQLSGGQRQRVAIGRAITRDPRIFLFDEPLSNLDAELRVQMRVELARLHAELRATMIYVTHDQVEAMTMADKIVVLRDGRLEQVGRPLDLYNRPVNRFVAGFIGSPRMNFLAGRIAGLERGTLAVDVDGLPSTALALAPAPDARDLAIGAAVTLGVRPEHLDLDPKGTQGWPLVVEVVEHLGGTSQIHGRLPDGARLAVTVAGQTALAPGARVGALPRPGLLHAFVASPGEAALSIPGASA
jgi:multiple sugar transport system ATP-binding protein